MVLKRVQEYLDRMETRRIERNRRVREKYWSLKAEKLCVGCGKPATENRVLCEDCRNSRLMGTIK